MSVLITGVNGLVGLHLAKILVENGLDVVGYDNNRRGELAFYPEVEKRIKVVWGDITQFPHLLETVERHAVDAIVQILPPSGMKSSIKLFPENSFVLISAEPITSWIWQDWGKSGASSLPPPQRFMA